MCPGRPERMIMVGVLGLRWNPPLAKCMAQVFLTWGTSALMQPYTEECTEGH